MKTIKHFHEELKCSAILIDWVELNKLTKESGHTFTYRGNYMDDDSNIVYAVFGEEPVNYCVKLH